MAEVENKVETIETVVESEPPIKIQENTKQETEQLKAITNMPTANPAMQTAPFDPRFPNTNQTRYCYQSYLDFHRCQKVKGDGYSPCQYFKKVYGSICPHAWVEKWDGQRDEGTFPGNI